MERHYLSIGLDNADRLLYEVEQEMMYVKDKLAEVFSYIAAGRRSLDKLISARLEVKEDEE